MKDRLTRTARLAALAGLAAAAATQPASAFYGSYAATCRRVVVYGGGSYMTALCRRVDGTWRRTAIHGCGGAGVRNENGHLRCGS